MGKSTENQQTDKIEKSSGRRTVPGYRAESEYNRNGGYQGLSPLIAAKNRELSDSED